MNITKSCKCLSPYGCTVVVAPHNSTTYVALDGPDCAINHDGQLINLSYDMSYINPPYCLFLWVFTCFWQVLVCIWHLNKTYEIG